MAVSSLESSQWLESTDLPTVLEVREVVGEALGPTKSGACIELVREALAEAYPGLVSESVHPPGYTWEWDGVRWVLTCTINAVFILDFGKLGGVRVEVEDRIPLS